MAAVVRKVETEIDPDELDQLAQSLTELAARLRAKAADEIQLPEFSSDEERERWWESQPGEDADIDPGLLRSVSTSIRLSASVIEEYNSLAEELGVRSGQTLMKMALSNFLARHRPHSKSTPPPTPISSAMPRKGRRRSR